MHQSIAFLVAFSVALGARAEKDDCRPEKDETQAWQCCKVDHGTGPDEFLDSVKKCFAENPMPPKPSGPPNEADIKEMEQVLECVSECIFADKGMLTEHNKVDKTKTVKKYKGLHKGDKERETMVTVMFDKCFATYMSDVDASSKCKSGAMQLEKCMLREGFLNCPPSNWTSSDECSKLKAKITKCPKIPIMILPP